MAYYRKDNNYGTELYRSGYDKSHHVLLVKTVF